MDISEANEEDLKIDPALLAWEPPTSMLKPEALTVDLTPEEETAVLSLRLKGMLTMADIRAAENTAWSGEGLLPIDLAQSMPETTQAKKITPEALMDLLKKSDAEFTSAVSSSVEGAAALYAEQRFDLLKTQLIGRLLSRNLTLREIPQAIRDVFSGAALADVASVSIKDALKDVSLGLLDRASDLHDSINTVLVASYDRFENVSDRFTAMATKVTLLVITAKAKAEKVAFKISSKWLILVIKILFMVCKIVLWILKWVLKVACIILGKALGWALKPVIPTVMAALSPLLLLSSEKAKTGIVVASPEESASIFERVTALRLCRWQYNGQTTSHFGPMAEEFEQSFNGIVDPTVQGTINVPDAVFLLMSTVQTLAAQNRLLAARVEALEAGKM